MYEGRLERVGWMVGCVHIFNGCVVVHVLVERPLPGATTKGLHICTKVEGGLRQGREKRKERGCEGHKCGRGCLMVCSRRCDMGE